MSKNDLLRKCVFANKLLLEMLTSKILYIQAGACGGVFPSKIDY